MAPVPHSAKVCSAAVNSIEAYPGPVQSSARQATTGSAGSAQFESRDNFSFNVTASEPSSRIAGPPRLAFAFTRLVREAKALPVCRSGSRHSTIVGLFLVERLGEGPCQSFAAEVFGYDFALAVQEVRGWNAIDAELLS